MQHMYIDFKLMIIFYSCSI